jgi:hypothetical protein
MQPWSDVADTIARRTALGRPWHEVDHALDAGIAYAAMTARDTTRP